MHGGLAKSLFSCHYFLLQTHNFTTHHGIVTLDRLEVLLTALQLALELHIFSLYLGELILQGHLSPIRYLHLLAQFLPELFVLF